MVERLGKTQKDIIKHLSRHTKTNIATLQDVLNKPHPSYIKNAIDALVRNGLVREKGIYISVKGKKVSRWWLTRKGIGVAIVEGVDIDRLDETASQLYSGEELDKIKIVLAFGRVLGPKGMNHLRNFELSELNLDSEMFEMLANNPDFLKIAELPIYKKLREVFGS